MSDIEQPEMIEDGYMPASETAAAPIDAEVEIEIDESEETDGTVE